MQFLFFILVLIAGASTPVQTAVNSALERSVKSPFAASFFSFVVGTVVAVVVAALTLRGGQLEAMKGAPWYAYCGGVCGLVALTSFIVLFPKIGGMETVLLPVFGQIVTALAIDSFGLFGMEKSPFTASDFAGMLLVMAGVILVVWRKEDGVSGGNAAGKLPWRILGLVAGALIAMQSAMNGALTVRTGSPYLAAAYSFVTSTLLLFILVLCLRSALSGFKLCFTEKRPWWTSCGGFLGAFIVIAYAASVPYTGVGMLAVLSILGQLIASVCIDRFGLMGARKYKVTFLQYTGVAVVFAGALIINYL